MRGGLGRPETLGARALFYCSIVTKDGDIARRRVKDDNV